MIIINFAVATNILTHIKCFKENDMKSVEIRFINRLVLVAFFIISSVSNLSAAGDKITPV